MTRWRRTELLPGVYDEIVTSRLREQIGSLPPTSVATVEALSKSADITAPIAAVLRDVVEAAFDDYAGDPQATLGLAEALLHAVMQRAPKVLGAEADWKFSLEKLSAVIARPITDIRRPLGSLHRSGLIVNAEGDQLLDHLRSEFDSADEVNLLCAFIKLSGVEKLRRELERHCVEYGRRLRVLTTTYMGASDQAAIERMSRLPNVTLKISYDENVTRLHAKAWLFHRRSGVSIAYVGSSNLSHAAQTEGLEWNVRIAESEQPAVVAQIRETFEQYWEDSHQFEAFDPSAEQHRRRLARALSPSRRVDGRDEILFEVEPRPHQRPVLEELAAARRLGRHRNLLVAARGTGKTFMAALDYRELRRTAGIDTLLFVAHRREILEQSIRVFRSALQLQDFGELLHQYEKPTIGRHVFASIDSLSDDSVVDPSAYDMVILDEAHHASADSWERLLSRVRPRELLGMTGTPERADGLNYEHHFPRPWIGNLRLWNAIPHALVPFRYYMLDVDGVDLRDVRWSRGRYVDEDLARTLIGAADVFVSRAMRALREHIGRPNEIRAIAFCVDKRHAAAIAERFERDGYRALALDERTPRDVRRDARRELDAGRIQVLCVVDLYNEGVDVPNVNTLFFFRPTESATVFLQQLGRGLRRTSTKPELVVFDLTGRHRVEFRFDRRLRAALGHTPKELREFVETGFGRLPSGCHFHFDEHAREDILAQIRRSVPTDLRGIRDMIRDPAHADLSLARFLEETDVELADLYGSDRGWTLLRRAVGLDKRPLADAEEEALRSLPKVLHVGDDWRLDAWLRAVEGERPTSERERRLIAMLFVILYGKQLAATDQAWACWERHDVLRSELRELIPVLADRNRLLADAHELHPVIPLRLHARYLGSELSAAFDQRTAKGEFRDFYTGVERVGEGKYDLLLVTLEKAAAKKEHLKYRDFPLNEHRFHWQSKARTTQASREGRRHLDPHAEGCTPLLFVRDREDDRPGITGAFQYLGPVSPGRHEGERPITIEWELRFAMPSALVARGRIAA